MPLAFIIGLIIGFLMCIPIGPLNVWVINTHLRKSAAKALAIAAGGSVMDLVYFLVILSGLSLFEFSDTMRFSLKALGIVLIFALGIKELLSKVKSEENGPQVETPQGIFKALLTGVVIYTSNPTLILTMTGLGAFVKSLELFPLTMAHIILISLGLGIGSFFWFVFLVKVVDRYQETIREKYLKSFVKVSGVLMIGLSLLMGQQLYINVMNDKGPSMSIQKKN